jgi:hypothetical protein
MITPMIVAVVYYIILSSELLCRLSILDLEDCKFTFCPYDVMKGCDFEHMDVAT